MRSLSSASGESHSDPIPDSGASETGYTLRTNRLYVYADQLEGVEAEAEKGCNHYRIELQKDLEFGEERVIEGLQVNREPPPPALLGRIVDGVRQFNPSEQNDDVTLAVARCRAK